MKFSKNIFLPVTAVLFVLAIHSQASPLSIAANLNDVTQAEKILTDPIFQNLEDVLIKISRHPDSVAAKAALDDIKKIGQRFNIPGALQLGAEKAIEGVIEATRLVANFGRRANSAIDKASELLKANDKEGATRELKKELAKDRELIFAAGVPIHDAQGAALALSGGVAIKDLKNTIVAIQKSGSAVFEVDELADEIATLGISAGGDAAEKAFQAARKTISAGLATVYADLKEAAKDAIDGMVVAASSGTAQSNNVTGIIDSLRTKVTTDNPSALEALARLDKGFASVSKVLTKKTVKDAAEIIHRGLSTTITETADAINVVKKEILDAAKLAVKNPEAAVDGVRKAIKSAEDKIFYGSAPGYLSLGAASEICGKLGLDALVPAVLEVEYGRVSCFEDLALSERAAIVGIRSDGGAAVGPGIEAAHQICDAAGATLYQDYADAGIMGFDALRNL